MTIKIQVKNSYLQLKLKVNIKNYNSYRKIYTVYIILTVL